jgi:hypothetical protein
VRESRSDFDGKKKSTDVLVSSRPSTIDERDDE